MFKRAFWFGSGVASGVAGSVYVKRKVKQQVEKLTPEAIRKQAMNAAVTSVVDSAGVRAANFKSSVGTVVENVSREGRGAVDRLRARTGSGPADTAGGSAEAASVAYRRNQIRAVPDG